MLTLTLEDLVACEAKGQTRASKNVISLKRAATSLRNSREVNAAYDVERVDLSMSIRDVSRQSLHSHASS